MDYKITDYNKGYLIGLIIVAFIGVALFFVPFWALWNWLMPLFGLPKITILQSVGLYLLLRIILFQSTYTHKQ
jgi:hypothetical protein